MMPNTNFRQLFLICLAWTLAPAGCASKAPEPAATPVMQESVTQTTSPAPSSPEQPVEEALFELEPDFVQLTLPQFEAFQAEPETWKETTQGIACTGKPRGYLISQQSYRNFTLRLDYRFDRPVNLKDEAKFKGNTGFLVYLTGENKLWPVCIEVQGKHLQMAAIKENGGADPVTASDDDAARRQARHAVGSWNSLEIVSKDGTLNVSLNGIPVSHSEAGSLSEGKIGIQSEDHPFEVRRMRIRAE